MRLFPLLVDAQYRKLRLLCAVVLYLAVLILGSIPGARSEVAQVASGLVLHFVTYSCIAFLLFTGLDSRLSARALITVLVIAGMGALDEYAQSFFPYRHATVRDWLVDAAAGLLMSGLLVATLPKKSRSLSAKSLQVRRISSDP